jgi:ribonuclease BN (tRNA processing enzyme)
MCCCTPKTLTPTKEDAQTSVAVASNQPQTAAASCCSSKLAAEERFDAFGRTRTQVHQSKLAFRRL